MKLIILQFLFYFFAQPHFSFTTVRKSTRGKKDEREEEKAAADVPPPTSLDASSSPSAGRPEIQRTEATRRAHVDAASAGQELQPELPENQTEEGCMEEGEEEKEGWSRADIKGTES